MTGTKKGIVRRVLLGTVMLCGILAIGAGTPLADEPQLLIYPDTPTIFRYDPGRYELMGPSDPDFDTLYSISNQMLWDKVEQRVPEEIYRAPLLVGFEPSPYGMNEFVLMQNEFNITIDGYGTAPRSLNNLYMRFVPMPEQSNVTITLSRQDESDLFAQLPPLAVTTPTGDGHYADTYSRHLTWSGAVALRITVYNDKNNNRVCDGVPTYSILVEDNTVTTEETTWGAVKALYRGQ